MSKKIKNSGGDAEQNPDYLISIHNELAAIVNKSNYSEEGSMPSVKLINHQNLREYTENRIRRDICDYLDSLRVRIVELLHEVESSGREKDYLIKLLDRKDR